MLLYVIPHSPLWTIIYRLKTIMNVIIPVYYRLKNSFGVLIEECIGKFCDSSNKHQKNKESMTLNYIRKSLWYFTIEESYKLQVVVI